MAYTPFSILVATIIVSMAFTSTSSVEQNIIDPSNTLSIEKSWEETQKEYALQSLRTLADENSISSYNESLTNLTLRGVHEGSNVQNVNFKNWSKEISRSSNTVDSLEINGLSVNTEYLTVKVDSTLSIGLRDLSKKADSKTYFPISKVKDPFLEDKLGYNTNMSGCSYSNLAERIDQGDLSNGTARGSPIYDSDVGGVSSPGKKILLTENVTRHDKDIVDDYAGFASELEHASPEEYNENYVLGINELPEFDLEENSIIHEGLWRSNFERTMETECYLSTTLIESPSIENRIKNEAGNDQDGIFTVLDVSKPPLSENSSKSNIGFERGSTSDLVKIEGVSNSEGKEVPYFRISRSLAEEEIENLIR